MADINLNFNEKDLVKAAKELQSAARNIERAFKKAGGPIKSDLDNLKRVAKASKLLATEKKKLSNTDREQIRIAKQLQTVNAKLATATSKEARELAAKRKQLRDLNRELRTGIKNTNAWGKALGSFQFKFNALGNIAANAVSRITQGLQQAIKESIMLAAKAEGVEAAFRSLNKPGLLSALQKATRGTVDNLTLMQKAVQARNFKIPLEQLATYFEFATNRAIQTGESVDYLVESIITGIGRKSVLVMDNLGISAVELQEEVKKVGDFGAAAGIIIQRELEAAGHVADTTATKIANIKTIWENVKTEFGQFILGQTELDQKLRKTSASLDKYTKGLFDAFRITGGVFAPGVFHQNIVMPLEAMNKELHDMGSKTVDIKELFDTSFEGDFQQSWLWAMSIAMGDLADDSLPKVKKIVDDLSDAVLDPLDFGDGGAAARKVTKDFQIASEKRFRAEEKTTKDQAVQDTEDAEQLKQDKIAATFELARNATVAFSNLFEAQKQRELSAVGDNAKKREEIELKYHRRQKVLGIGQALVDGALAIQKLQGQLGVAAPPFIIASAALTAAQVGIIASQKFAEGEVDIKGASHSRGGINAEIEGGESVINKRSTSKYKGLLEAINQDDQMRIMDAMSRDKKISISGSGDPYTRKMYELMQTRHSYGEDEKYYYKQVGNAIHMTKK